MSKRLIRVNPSDALKQLGKMAGTEINAVLQNDRTYFGNLVSIDTDFLILIDSRSHVHKIRLTDLYEIVYDKTNIETVMDL